MQSTYASWVPTVSPSPLNLTNSKPRLSNTSPNQTQRNGDIDNSAEVRFPLPTHIKSITSTSNPFIKHCVKLRQSSPYRHAHGSALVVGTTPIREICKFQKSLKEETVEMECLILPDKAKVPEGLDSSSTRTLRVSALVMKRLSQLQSTESIEAIALMKFPTSYFVVGDHQKDADFRKWFPSPHRILVLEGIQDPGNLGTLVRSAVAFRWGGIFLLPGCCDPFNDKALKASRGASFQVPIVSGSWHHLEALKDEFQMKMLAGHPASDDEQTPVSELSQGFADSLADIPICLVLGNEGQGLSEKSLQECQLVSIPMARNYESLNVAVAGGIFLYMLQPKHQGLL
ncbi:RNA binding protein, putative [Ricinus communis]|uniref:RNA binding protein, putative n=1 Tax=Ricinus communis TaxID=3988 RepID=B9T2B4_RICCO|nr:RNA binding protein, putative [Ricinus communis]|eukprot:XP_002532383.1 uncharacterized protein LOC8277492 [Ricinus communis]